MSIVNPFKLTANIDRDKIKQDIASKKGDLNDTRDMLTKLDTEV